MRTKQLKSGMDMNNETIIAQYKCCKCHHKYNGKPGPQDPCHKCGSLYIKWLNYDELYRKYFRKQDNTPGHQPPDPSFRARLLDKKGWLTGFKKE